jgi:uncharacterized membrane protein
MRAGARRSYLDWLRGVAVLIMIESHLLDSWTADPDRQTTAFSLAMILGGMGAPLFLFLAGVSVPLSAASKLRRTGSVLGASGAVVRRGLEILGLAFLFRIQAWILGWSSPRLLLRVDILNIMGPSIAAAGGLWGLARSARGRVGVFAAATGGLVFLTPIIRNAPLGGLPDPIEAYIRPVSNLDTFVFFPWTGFVFAGAMVGLLVEDTPPSTETRLIVRLTCAGLAVAALSFGLSYLPSPYANSSFWTTSPSYFFLRAGIMTAAIGAAYAWQARPGGTAKWSPLSQLGRTSLFIYWIHVEMIYGLISLPLHRALTLPQAALAYALFTPFMLACSIAKDRVVARWTRGTRTLEP